MFCWRLTTEMLHFFSTMLQECGLIWAFCCPTRLDSFGTECSKLHWCVPAILQGSTAHDRDFTLYITGSKYMPHNFQCSEDKVFDEQYFPHTKKKKEAKEFIFYCSSWKWYACADMGTWSHEGLCTLISPVPSARTILLNFWLVFYLHFQIQNIATHAMYEELELEPLLWDLDEIQTCRGSYLMAAISWTHTLHPHLSSCSTCVHRDTPQLASPTAWVCVRMSREESLRWFSQWAWMGRD